MEEGRKATLNGVGIYDMNKERTTVSRGSKGCVQRYEPVNKKERENKRSGKRTQKKTRMSVDTERTKSGMSEVT
jgi:hypothetical protein